jgi:hypothetical protein
MTDELPRSDKENRGKDGKPDIPKPPQFYGHACRAAYPGRGCQCAGEPQVHAHALGLLPVHRWNAWFKELTIE